LKQTQSNFFGDLKLHNSLDDLPVLENKLGGDIDGIVHEKQNLLDDLAYSNEQILALNGKLAHMQNNHGEIEGLVREKQSLMDELLYSTERITALNDLLSNQGEIDELLQEKQRLADDLSYSGEQIMALDEQTLNLQDELQSSQQINQQWQEYSINLEEQVKTLCSEVEQTKSQVEDQATFLTENVMLTENHIN
jgi:chromosome segregation ATPase